MVCIKLVLSAIEDFLRAAESLGILQEFKITPADVDRASTYDFEKKFEEFVLKINSSDQNSKKEQSPTQASCTTETDKAIVQIQINKTEMQRRISAFKSWKRKEVEETNVQEFCSRPYMDEVNPLWGQIDSCSRVDTVFMPRFGKGHYKVSKVENRYGPNVQTSCSSSKKIAEEADAEVTLNDVSLETIQERLQAMESHLKLKTESSLRCNIIQRLKKLEDKILFLEGISPDYLHYARPSFTSPQKKAEVEKEKLYSNLNYNDLQKRMHNIRETLKSKSLHLQKGNSG